MFLFLRTRSPSARGEQRLGISVGAGAIASWKRREMNVEADVGLVWGDQLARYILHIAGRASHSLVVQ